MKNKTQYFTINIVIMLVLISFSPISTLSIKIEKTTLKNTKNNVDESSSLILSNTIEDAISLNIKGIKKQSDLYKYQNKSSKTININFDTSKARIDPKQNGEVYLYLEGTTPSGSPGEPMIPMKSIKLELPKNSKILEIAMTDVEYKEPAKKYAEFQINVDETYRYCKVQEKYRLHIWYVFSNAINHFSTWYWIPVSKVKEIGEERKYRGYYGIPQSR